MKVSVVTPVLNGESTLKKCILSVKNQTFVDIEHVIVDACSRDKTVEIAKEMGVTCLTVPDSGIYEGFNNCIAQASGDIIHILNADDYYSKSSSVAEMVDIFIEKKCDLCHAKVNQVNQNGDPVKTIGKSIKKSELLRKMRVAHPGTFVKKELYEKFGHFSEGFKIAADHEFLLRVWDECIVEFHNETIVNMRIGGASTSQVKVSYRESMAAAILHGENPICATGRFYLELLKSIFYRL